jgi:hypothetical protein
MGSITAIDEKTGRKFYLDDPDDLKPGEALTFILNLHGGGSVGMWQHEYFPAYLYKEKHRLVVATPSAATKEPSRHWVAEADDEHLQNIVNYVQEKYGKENIIVLACRSLTGRHDVQSPPRHRLLQGAGGRLAEPLRRPDRPGGALAKCRPAW